MSSPSTTKINASSSKIVRNTKRDVNASRSRAFGASSISNSSRKVTGTAGGGGSSAQSARVFLDGVDVTPQSLLLSRIKPSTAQGQRSGGTAKGKGGATATRRSRNAHGGGGGGNSVVGASVILSNTSASSVDDSSDNDAPSSSTSGGGTRGSGAGTKVPTGAPTPKSNTVTGPSPVFSALSAPPASANQNDDDDAAGPESDEPLAASDPKPSSASTDTPASLALATSTTATAATSASTQVKPERTRRRPITIELAETSTMIVFELRSVCVGADTNYHQAVAARNRQYLEMCTAKRGSDKFIEGRSQTLQLAQKGKEVMTAPPATRDVMCVATDWDIFDCARIEEDNQNEHDESGGMDAPSASSAAQAGAAGSKSARALSEYENGDLQLKRQVDEIVEATLVSPGCVLDVDGDIVEDLRARQHARARRGKHHGTNSQKSRTYHMSSSAQSQQESGRSSALVGGYSSSSMASASQSGASLSFGASQDVAGSSGGVGDDSGSSGTQSSQAGMSSASRVLSGDGSGDGNKQNAYARANTNVDIGETIAQQRTAKVLASRSLLKTASIVERAVQQNVYHQQHVLYRNFPSLADPGAGDGPGAFSRKDNHMSGENDWRSIGGASGSGAGSRVHAVPDFSSSTSGGFGGARNGAATGKGALEKLWAFQCELTENRRVSCLAWNTVNEDLLVVSYGHVESRSVSSLVHRGLGDSAGGALAGAAATVTGGGYITGGGGGQPLGAGGGNGGGATAGLQPAMAANGSGAESSGEDDGLILFWSLKNPEYPERIYNLGVGVTSIDFSHSQPYLLAVGFVNGVVAIYDTRKDDSVHSSDTGGANGPAGALSATAASVRRLHTPVPVATSEVSSGKHLDVLWQVKWISKGSDRGENVVSISSDGRVTEWSMKKGLSYSDLMTLKRIANPLLGSDSRADGVISRQASGHCIDFVKSDPSVYFVGTEDGLIHKCSVSYNEQYLQTYLGHTGPVYQILVSPFCSDLFLTCSGDWNIKLWHQGEQREALNFRSVDLAHAVHGISWCPSNSTIFSAVTEDGRIEIWDLQQSTLDPVITHFPKKYMRVVSAPATARVSPTGLDSGNPQGDSALDNFDDPLVAPMSSQGGFGASLPQPVLLTPQEIPLECTKIAFAPSAPVIVVGDSTGDVTVYRVPTLADACANETLSVDEQVAKLLRAMNPNKHE